MTLNLPARQPVHTVYGGAHLFRRDTVKKLGLIAVRSLFDTAEDSFAFAEALELPEAAAFPATMNGRMSLLRRFTRMGSKAKRVHPQAWFAYELYQRVLRKLREEPIEDYRIDFEDGYGFRRDEEEDRHAVEAADNTADAMDSSTLPPYFGIRIKPFKAVLRPRAERTLRLFLSRLSERMPGSLPAGFVVTLPKVDHPSEVRELTDILTALESECALSNGVIQVEMMVERPSLLSDAHGEHRLRSCLAESQGRLRGIHLGLYDYLSSLGIPSPYQTFDHRHADHLRSVVASTFAETGVMLSDGATNLLPIGPHRGDSLSSKQRSENVPAVVEGWRTIFRNVELSQKLGFPQGWDLHPSQFVPRYAAVYSMYLREKDRNATRLKAFLAAEAKARVDGQQFDDIATGWGLLQFYLRGKMCGALTDDDIKDAGLTPDQVQRGSIHDIVSDRLVK